MRSVFVQRKVLELYQNMDSVSYPIQPELLLQCIPKSCRILSYQEMAEVTGCTVQDLPFYAKAILERRTTIQIQTVILFSTMLK